MRGILAFLAGVAGATAVAWLFERNARFRNVALDATDRLQRTAESARKSARNVARAASQVANIDLNSCSREDLIHAGLSEEMANRVIENRPYRNKLDLISRLVVPENVYNSIKHRVGVNDGAAQEPVKVAS